jgi:hypothetical protein
MLEACAPFDVLQDRTALLWLWEHPFEGLIMLFILYPHLPDIFLFVKPS